MKNIFKTSILALIGAVFFTACEDDRDSNPVLTADGNVTFQLNAPEVGTAAVDLAKSEGIALTWSQPVVTDKNAPLASAGVYGFRYVAQLSKDGNFTKSFAEALAEATDSEGNIGKVTGQDYTTMASAYSAASGVIPAAELNRALNELYVWEEENLPQTAVSTYIRIVAQYVNGKGEAKNLAISNTQQINTILSEWVDVTAKPVEISYLWVPGGGNGWDHAVSPKLICEDGVTYKGYAYLDGEFKFTDVAGWDGTEFNNGSFTSTSENIDLGDGAGGNIVYTGAASMCWIEVSPSKGELIVTPVKWGIVGGFNSWSVDDGKIVDMTFDTAEHCLKATIADGISGEWKFARDNSWDVNFGGALDALVQDGPNLTNEGTVIRLFIERADEKPHATVE